MLGCSLGKRILTVRIKPFHKAKIAVLRRDMKERLIWVLRLVFDKV